jgi:serine/threonine protein phosphatase PrpC
MRTWLLATLTLTCLTGLAADGETETQNEIDFLLTAVGDSGCSFLRNGEAHSSSDAEAHLRMKYRRGRRHASTTEQFIERLASGSSISRQPYLILCGDADPVPTYDWLSGRLREYRESK